MSDDVLNRALYLALGEIARTKRESLGLSYRDVSDLTGIPVQRIAELESGKLPDMYFGEMLRVAQAIRAHEPLRDLLHASEILHDRTAAFAIAFGKVVCELRADMTPPILAVLSGIDLKRLAEIEFGSDEPTIYEVRSLAIALDTTASDLIARAEVARDNSSTSKK